MCSVTAEELWRGVLAESGAGARKGRGKRTKRKLRRDLNRGQNIGEGKTLCSMCFCRSHPNFLAENVFFFSLYSGRGGFLWPGLNAPVLKDGSVQSMGRRGEAEQQEVQAELGTHK